MRVWTLRVVHVMLCLLAVASLSAQQPASSSPGPAIPPFVRVTGTFTPANGRPAAPVETVTLAIYGEEQGGAPLWQETQDVVVDAVGRYAVLLGATQPDGLPLDLFASGDARWLGRRFDRPGEHEQARVLLASVPYALKAADADTLGGHPSSAYLLADAGTSGSSGTTRANGTSVGPADRLTTTSASVQPTLATGTTNYVAKFTNTTDLGSSAIYDAGGLVGVNTAAPADTLHVRFMNTTGTMTGLAVQNLGSTVTSYSGMLFYDQNGTLGQFQGFNNSTHEYRINNIAAGGSINFMLGGSSKFHVRADGDVEIPGSLRQGGVPFLHHGGSNSSSNTFLGVNAGNLAVTGAGSMNTAVGEYALSGDSTGYFNTASGAFALVSNTQGFYNTASGTSALQANTTGVSNTAIGVLALRNSTTGIGNVAIGVNAGENATTGSYNIYLGTDVGGSADDVNTIYLGKQGTQTKTFIAGIRGITTAVADAVPVVIDSAGQLGTISSSRRFKEDVRDMGHASRALFALRPVTFRYAQSYADGTKPIQYGLVAEEVAEAFPELAVRNADGGVDTVHYETLSVLLLNELQKQQIEMQNRTVRQQQHDQMQTQRIEMQQQRIEALERRLNALLETRE